MEKPSFNVYIDESGDEGFDFNKRTPKWFIISAVITRTEHDLETLNGIMKVIKSQLKYENNKEIHFRKLKHEQKIPYLSLIANARIRTITVAIHKPDIKEQENFQQKDRLYFYACRYLLERVCWFCRDNFSSEKHCGNGTMKLIFSKRKNMSYDDLKRYLSKLLSLHENGNDIRIEPSILKVEQIRAYAAAQRMGLQIADAVASSAFQALNKSDYGFTEDKYISILRRTMYSHKKRIQGYGFKVWPELEKMEEDELFQWLFR